MDVEKTGVPNVPFGGHMEAVFHDRKTAESPSGTEERWSESQREYGQQPDVLKKLLRKTEMKMIDRRAELRYKQADGIAAVKKSQKGA